MTLTELKYIVAVARERHFGRAAQSCFVSQPSLSVAIRKLEQELGVQIFERGAADVSVTPMGGRIIEQARHALEQTDAIRAIARQGNDPLSGPLRVGVIYTIGPYLLPGLVHRVIADTPQMPLILQENFTVRLLEMLRQGELDVAILADPFDDSGLMTWPLYDEPFVVAVPRTHAWAQREAIAPEELTSQTMLLLGSGHCFRDQVLGVCPEMTGFAQSSDGIRRTFEGSSLETIRHMVASGIGITVMPVMARPQARDGMLEYVPFTSPLPSRQVALAWRKSFPRPAAIEALRGAVLGSVPDCVELLPDAAAVAR